MAIGSLGTEQARLGAFPSPCLFPSVSQEMSGLTASCRFALLLWAKWFLAVANGLKILVQSCNSCFSRSLYFGCKGKADSVQREALSQRTESSLSTDQHRVAQTGSMDMDRVMQGTGVKGS